MNNESRFSVRRRMLFERIGEDNAAVLFGSKELVRNGDVHYPFRQNSTFYYFTGFSEPDAVAVFLPGHKDGPFILFNIVRNKEMEQWLGPCASQEGAVTIYGADSAFDIGLLDEKIVDLLADRQKIFYEMGCNKTWDQTLLSWVRKLQGKHRKKYYCPSELADVSVITHEMRLKKDPLEISLLRQVAEKSAQAHIKAIERCCPQLFEYQLEAVINFELINQDCRFSAYPAIVGGGKNACILHYVENKDILQSGDLVLIDAGGEYQNYAADITRTFPVNGKFSKDQAAVYQVVLDAQLAVIDAIKPGIPWNALQELAVKVLVKGMVSLGILSGKIDEIITTKAYQQYYMHNIGHWLGLDVHDVGRYQVKGESRLLEEGMVFTVEPGLYLSANNQLAKRWWGIGIRIEDDILVTDKGCEILSHTVPKTINDLENLMA